jgi:hypothetical protein
LSPRGKGTACRCTHRSLEEDALHFMIGAPGACTRTGAQVVCASCSHELPSTAGITLHAPMRISRGFVNKPLYMCLDMVHSLSPTLP